MHNNVLRRRLICGRIYNVNKAGCRAAERRRCYMGSLQTKGNRYYVVISTQGGKQKWISTGLKTKPGNYRKAKQYLTEVENQYNTNPSVFETEDFVSYARKWLKEIQGCVDPITYEAHKQHLEKHIIPYFSR